MAQRGPLCRWLGGWLAMAAAAAVECGVTDFAGRRVNVVQIGLGTNSTFMQNLAGPSDEWNDGISWCLEVTSEASPERITGVAVEPMLEHSQALRPIAASLPGVALVQRAIGETDGESMLHMLPMADYKVLLRRVPWWQKGKVKEMLLYILNMSSVGREHPAMHLHVGHLESVYGVQVRLKQMHVEVWSWDRLARELNFLGCEVLIVDTEGHDVKILRSLIAHCQAHSARNYNANAWPYVIQFETQGHSDKVEGMGAEWGIITELEHNGYTVVHYSHSDTQLARSDLLRSNDLVKAWAWRLRCHSCKRWNVFPYVTRHEDRLMYCKSCFDKRALAA